MSDLDKRGVRFMVLVVCGAVLIGLAIARQAGGLAKSEDECRPMADPYGTPPAGYQYQKAVGSTREEVVKELELKGLERYALDVTVVWKDEDVRGFVMSANSDDRAEIDAVWASSGTESGEKLHRGKIGDVDVKYTLPSDGSRTTWALKGCTMVLTAGVTRPEAVTIANAVFKD